jgi:protease-4
MSRKMTPEEEELLQGVIDNVYTQFVDTIVSNRYDKLKEMLIKKGIKEPAEENIREAVTSVADGRIFSGKQALAYGLVDKMGTFEDAVLYAADAADIKGEPALVYEKKKINFFELLSGSEETDGMLNKFFFKGMCYLYGE